ncbi:aldehyde dehydrogenase [Kineosporia sp. J2-2]|uniref:Aldehyde dehydrogenase n=1 Tax=Kineosporia corallincola TaxID=2835133 RepID=A0ABS5TEW2_9ACTN|nr:aldehyde dehydrogenase family protein [Kineosporia corallincola]MBT0769627.1 aldehyde dehydrogenase [Kineosporia corallincola]
MHELLPSAGLFSGSQILQWIAGESRPGGGKDLPLTDAVTGSKRGDLRASSPGDVDSAVTSAAQAFPRWRHTPASERAAALREAAATVRAHTGELGRILSRDTGRLLGQATDSAAVAADLLDEAAVTGVLEAGRSLAGNPLAVDAVRREPRGPVAVLTPWNDPYPAAAGLLAAALVTGNTVVHKPSERSPAAGWALASLIAARLPAGVLNVLAGDGEVGAALVADPRVAVVAHIGSTATGRDIARVVGGRGGRVLLENGGKDPIVVDSGVDPRWAAEQIAIGAFTNTGQLCTSVERVYLHRDVAEAVTAELVRIAEAMVTGDPGASGTDLGPLVDERQLAVVARHVDEAVAAGATCLTGGRRLDRPGCFYPPTVLTGCRPDLAVMREETFGPVAAIMTVPDFDEALKAADDTDYGLAATVLTPSTAHALRAAAEIDAGTVKVNAVFGGAPGGSADPRRGSGHGPGFGPALLGEFTALKAVHIEAAP